MPLKKENGIEMHYLQAQYKAVYLTSLIEYQTHGENARPYYVFRFFDELINTRDIVLVRGDLTNIRISDSLIHSLENNKTLFKLVQLFYSTLWDKGSLVKKFNEKPGEFIYNELIDQANSFYEK